MSEFKVSMQPDSSGKLFACYEIERPNGRTEFLDKTIVDVAGGLARVMRRHYGKSVAVRATN